MRLELFGNARLLTNNQIRTIAIHKPTALLIYLAYRNEWVSRDELCYLFDPDVVDAVARRKLRIQIYRAKQLSWANSLEIKNNELRFIIQNDVVEFDNAISEKNYQKALKIYKGQLLSGLKLTNSNNFQAWLEHERSLRREQWLEVNKQYSHLLENNKKYQEAISHVAVALKANPLDEPTLQNYMRLNQMIDNKELALKAYYEFTSTLQAEMGFGPSETTKKLAKSLEKTAVTTPLSKTKDQSNSPIIKLPYSGTKFVGRSDEIKILSEFYSQDNCRLISIIGAGGSGKTRLSIEIARQISPNFQQGVFFVGLASTKSSELMPVSIAEQLNLSLSGGKAPEKELLNFLREKNLLLVLDNMEHLLDGLELIQNILQNCPGVHILVSSRERLKLPAERVLDIQGLCYEQTVPNVEVAAVSLFLETAKRLGRLKFTNTEIESINNICSRLEGMPLAIELAASWLRVLSCQEIDTELKHNFELLDNQNRLVSDNHQSQRLVFEHSWQLLSAEEKSALSKLSIFDSSFDRHAALAIAKVHLSLLLSLVDKSLLVYNRRFYFHELIRYFAYQKLNLEDKEGLANKYSVYFSQILAKHSSDLHSKDQLMVLSKLNSDFDNFRSFWKSSIQSGAFQLLDDALSALFDLYSLKSYFQEGVNMFNLAAETAKDKNRHFYYRLNARKGRFLMRLGRYDEDLSILEECEKYFENLNEKEELAGIYLTLGTIHRNKGDLETSKEYYEKCLESARKTNDFYREALAINNLGIVAYRESKVEEAKLLYEQSLKLFRAAGLNWATTLVLNNLGIISYAQNRLDEANSYFSENVPIFDEIGDIKGKALSISNLGTIAYEQGFYEKAINYHNQSLPLILDIGETWAISNDYANLGFSYLKLGEYEKARNNLKKSLIYSKELNIPPMMLYALIALAGLEHKQSNTQKAKELFQFIMSHPASSQAVKDRCKNLLKDFEISITDFEELSTSNLHGLEQIVDDYLKTL